jgi:hypothetical protein
MEIVCRNAKNVPVIPGDGIGIYGNEDLIK